MIFLEVRDATGVLQCVVEEGQAAFETTRQLRLESVIVATGVLELRAQGTRNPKLESGDVELRLSALEVVSEADPLPFAIQDETAVPEELRLRYRFLDLRRQRLRNNVLLRARAIARLRELMTSQGSWSFKHPS